MRHRLSFRINPSQPYFSLSDHVMSLARERAALHLPGTADYVRLRDRTEIALRALYCVPAHWEIFFLRPSSFLMQLRSMYDVVISGHGCFIPVSPDQSVSRKTGAEAGIRIVALSDRYDGRDRRDEVHGSLVDLSHTFPVSGLVLESAAGGITQVCGALGVPSDLVVIFTRPDLLPDIVAGTDWASSFEIALLGRIAGDLLEKGHPVLQRESVYKSALIRSVIDATDFLEALPPGDASFSQNIFCARTTESAGRLASVLEEAGLRIEAGDWNDGADNCLRLAAYPVHSREQVELLADRLSTLVP